VVIYFGYPQGDEDEDEEAIRTPLILERIGTRKLASSALAVRISTGVVILGDLIGSGESQ
jgi:hypothetical protein